MTKQDIEAQFQFDAILAKNHIAREIKEFKETGVISLTWLEFNLKEIELYIGQMNQPNIKDILNSSANENI